MRSRMPAPTAWGLHLLLLALCQQLLPLAHSNSVSLDAGLERALLWSDVDEAHPDEAGPAGSSARHLLASGKRGVRGVPPSFTVRPAIDPTLCVYALDLSSDAAASASAAAGPSSVAENGGARLVLLPCSVPGDSSFTAEVVLGGYYFNAATMENYRQALVRSAGAPGRCWYGANSTYTDAAGGTNSSSSGGAPGPAAAAAAADDAADEAEWVDEYMMDFAPYFNYDLRGAPTNATSSSNSSSSNATATINNNTFDATSWGPFRTGWGPCTSNPSASASSPMVVGQADAQQDDERGRELVYQSWYFVGISGAACVSHLPAAARAGLFALLTLGPDRLQPDMAPLPDGVDPGVVSALLGSGDISYGGSYARKRSNELCLSCSSGGVRAGAQLRLASCNPVAPALDQAFQLVSTAPSPPPPTPRGRRRPPPLKKGAKAAKLASG